MKSFWVFGVALLAVSSGAAWAQQGTGSGSGPGGPAGVRMGTDGATTGSGQTQGTGTKSQGVGSDARHPQNFSRSDVNDGYLPGRRRPIRGKPDRGGPVETQPVPEPSTRPGQPGAQPPDASPRGR